MKKIILARVLFNTFFALLMFVGFGMIPSHFYIQAATTTDTTISGTSSVLDLTLKNPLGSTADIPSFIQKVLDGLVILLTPVIVVMFLWTGFSFVKAQGNPEDLTKAKSSLLYTIIGAALVLGAKGLSLVIGATIAQL